MIAENGCVGASGASIFLKLLYTPLRERLMEKIRTVGTRHLSPKRHKQEACKKCPPDVRSHAFASKMSAWRSECPPARGTQMLGPGRSRVKTCRTVHLGARMFKAPQRQMGPGESAIAPL